MPASPDRKPTGLSLAVACRAWVLLMVGALLLTGCSAEGDRPLRVGTNVWPGYETLYLARALGEYRDADIKLVELPNASEVIQALRNGTLEAAALTLDEALLVAQDGYDLRVVLVMDFSRGGDVVLGRPGIRDAADLRGRRVGVESTAVGAIMLDAVLRSVDLTIDDVDAVPITVDQHAEAFDAGRIDAVVTFEPVRSELLATGAEPLFDSSRIPNRIVDVLVVHADAAERHAEDLRTLLQGHFRAQAHLHSHPAESAAVIKARIGLAQAELADVYRGIHLPDLDENRRLLSAGPAGLEPVLRDLAELMHRRGMLHGMPDTGALLSSYWLPDGG